MQNQFKKIIVAATILVLVLGIFFGVKFYQNSKNSSSTDITRTTNIDPTRTPFQTRLSTSTDVDTIIDENVVENPTSTSSTQTSRLVQLWKEPVSGFDFVYKDIEVIATSTDTSTSTNIKKITNKKVLKNQEYVYIWERKTGHIYENLASTTNVARISNYTFPGVEEAFFADGTSAVARRLGSDNETISTYYVKLTKEFSTSTDYKTNLTDLKVDSNNISFSSVSKKIFYFLNKTGTGVIESIDGGVKSVAINTSISEWLPQYVNKDLVTLTTKPSAYFKGYMFSLATNGTSKNSYVLGEKYGFNTLMSPDGKKIIYSEIIDNTLETFIYDVKSKSITYLRQATIVDKCVWAANSKKVYCAVPQKLYQAPYPDSWYMNSISFSDNIWSVDAESGDFALVIPLQDMVPTAIDAYKMTVSASDSFLLFQDKNTLSLWKYDLN